MGDYIHLRGRSMLIVLVKGRGFIHDRGEALR